MTISVAANPTIQLASGTQQIHSLTSDELISLVGGTLDIQAGATISAPMTVAGGTLRNGTLTSSGGAKLVFTTAGGTLDGVTSNADLDLTGESVYATVVNGLTLNGVATIGGAGDWNRLVFAGSQTLGGTGSVVLAQGNTGGMLQVRDADTTLTIGSSMTVHGGADGGSFPAVIGYSDQVGGSPNVSVINQGTISADVSGKTIRIGGSSFTNSGTIQAKNGGTLEVSSGAWSSSGVIDAVDSTLNLNGAWSNTGTITATDSTTNLGGSFTLPGLGPFTRTGGVVNLTGTLDSMGATLAFSTSTGNWNLLGGTLRNGTLTSSGGAKLVFTTSGGTLDGVTSNADLDLTGAGAYATVVNGLTLNGVATVGGEAGNWNWLDFAGSQTLGGTGSVVLAGNNGGTLRVRDADTTLTIGPSMTVHGGSDAGSYAAVIGYNEQLGVSPNVSVINQGTIRADVPGKTIRIGGSSFTNSGTIQAKNGGTLDVQNLTGNAADNPALLRTSADATILLSGSLTGNTQNVSLFTMPGRLQLNGGSAGAPRLLEAMSNDGGNVVANFSNNFGYGALALGASSYVRLVDQSDNATGAGAEAVYADAIVVPSGSTLDLNGLHLYARAAQIDGAVINGTISQAPDSGPLALNTPTPGTISVAGELDEWQFLGFAGRTMGIIVNPGASPPYPAVSPQLGWADVQLLDSADNVLASASSASSDTIASISNFSLPATGTYKIRIRAAAGQSDSTGNYSVAAFDVTPDVANLNLNQQVFGAVETLFAVDRWNFSAAAGTQVQFLLKASSSPGLIFALTGPGGYTAFDAASPSSDPITLPVAGNFSVNVYGVNGAEGSYSFQLLQVSHTDLTLGQTFSGSYVSSGQVQVFRVPVAQPNPMTVTLVDSVSTDQVEIYAKHGSPPTRADYQTWTTTNTSGVARLLVPFASPGDWYIMVYGTSVTSLAGFTLKPETSPVQLTAVSPDRYGANSGVPLTISGSGFVTGVAAELVAADGTTFSSQSTVVTSFTQLTAIFDLTAAPTGAYAVRVTRPDGGAEVLPGAFQVQPAGVGRLETDLIVPPVLGRHATATLYVEYANTGNAALPAPILIVQSDDSDDSDRPLLTLDQSRLIENYWSSAVPPGLAHSVQIYASGATPGLLLPGERIRVPVYYTGLLQPWDFSDEVVELVIGVHEAGSTDGVNWTAMKSSLRPDWIHTDVWDAVYPNLTSQVGPTWGDYVQMLSDNAVYLGRLGLNVTDVNQLYNFELQQALGFSPVSTLSSTVDHSLPAPGLALSFTRSYANSMVDRFNSGPLGRGWNAPWQISLAAAPDDTVTIHQSAGAFRTFRPDSRRIGAYFSAQGDTGVLAKRFDGSYQLTETSGQVMAFHADGKLEYIEDVHGNRITAGYTSTRLSSLTHNSGGSLSIAYNAAGLISSVSDSGGRVTTYGYDPTNTFLTTVTGPQGTTTYTYDTSTTPTRKYALLSAQDPSGVVQHFDYDSHGRLSSAYVGNHLQQVTYAYDSAGTVTVTDAVGVFSKLYYDYRGLVVRSEDSVGAFINYEYDGNLRLAREVNSLGYSRSYTWCDCGQPKTITDELGHTTTFTLGGPLNQPTAFTDANGNVTEYGYNAAGDVTSTTYADGTVERTIYDALGNATSLVNRRGQAIGMTYNPAGQLATESFPDGSTNTYSYDARNRLETVNSSAQGVTTFTYDTADRLTRVDYPTGRSLKYQYDAAGRRTQLADNTDYLVNYVYDAVGRLSQLLDGSSGNAVLNTYTYDAAGRLTREDKGNGTYTVYTYDAVGRVEHLVNYALGGEVNSRFDYTYDVLGRRTSMGTLDGTWTYSYDLTSQLTRAVFSSTNASIPNQDLNYVYDSLGNRIRTILNGVSTEYATNNLNQYTQIGDVTNRYDADGNLVQEVGPDGIRTYTYDAKNRLIKLVTPQGTWEYEYDALGNRTASVVQGQRTEYLLDLSGLGDVIATYNSAGNRTAGFAYGNGLEATHAAGWSYYDFDALGSTAAITGADGSTTNVYSYAPFGKTLLASQTIANPFQFVGGHGIMADGNGLEFMRARYYSSVAGRFTSPDPIGVSGGVNLYAYTSNNGLNFIDPTGFVSINVGAGYFGLFGFLGGAATVSYNVGTGQKCGTLEFGVGFGGWGGAVTVGSDPSPGWTWPNFSGGWSVFGLPIGPGGSFDLDGGWSIGPGVGKGRGGAVTVGYTWCTPPPPPPRPPTPPNNPTNNRNPTNPSSQDPNEKLPGVGIGDQGFVAADSLIPYRINFENYESATAPAQQVVITDQLAASLDWSTLRFTEFGFGDTVASVPADLQNYLTSLPLAINGKFIDVQVELSFNPTTGQVRTTFLSLDPNTGLPPDVLTGFLPPEDGTGRGMGYFSYEVRAESGLATGTAIRNIAFISFDQQTVIGTNQIDPLNAAAGTDPAKEALITIDAGGPTSQVHSLPATASPTFAVTWSGADDASGSGIDSYDLYVSDNGGPYTPWLLATTLTTSSFTGQVGHTYAFYSTAIDNVGNREAVPLTPDAATRVAAATIPGDATGDGKVDLNDFGVLKASFGRSEPGLAADFDRNGRVDLTDFGILKDNFGNSGSISRLNGKAPSGAGAGYGGSAAEIRRLAIESVMDDHDLWTAFVLFKSTEDVETRLGFPKLPFSEVLDEAFSLLS